METPVIDLAVCEFNKERSYLKIASEYCGMPAKFYVLSNYTGKKILFTAVQPGDPLWDEDGWDGEQCIYRPTTPLPKVEFMVIYNQF
jgi:hypothetical protein